MAQAGQPAPQDAYQALLSSIMNGLAHDAPVSLRTRSRNHSAVSSSDASGDSAPSAAASEADTDETDSALAADARSTAGAAQSEGAQSSPSEAFGGPDVIGNETQTQAEEWPVVPWAPSIAAPAAATAEHAAQRRQRASVATSAHPGAAKLAQAPLRGVRKEQRSAARSKTASAGAGWFDMKAQTITPEVKQDWRLLRLRSAFDPRHFYKGFDSTKIPKHFEMGTVVEGAGEFYSGRLTRKQRKQTFTEEILNDVKIKQERKRRFDAMQAEKQEVARTRKKMGGAHYKRVKKQAKRPKH